MCDPRGDDGAETGARTGHLEQFDPETDDVSVAVMHAIASARDVTPTDLDPLTTSLDPDALTTLFSEASDGTRVRNGRLVFTHGDCVVTVTSDGHVRARPTE